MFTFVKQSILQTRQTGAVWPSGRRLARTMTSPLLDSEGPRRILEVGPGTGVFTREICKQLRPDDTYDIVEINPTFCRHVEQKVLPRHLDPKDLQQVRIHCDSLENVVLEPGYDHIFCGLPFNNFEPWLVRSLFRKMMSLMAEEGTLSFFEYIGVRMMRAPLVGRSGRKRSTDIERINKSLRRRFHGRREAVLCNIPPAYAVHLQPVA